MRRLLAWLRIRFWLVVGPPPAPPRMNAEAIARAMTEASGGFRSAVAFEFVSTPPDLTAEAEHIRKVARDYEQRTGRHLFGGGD